MCSHKVTWYIKWLRHYRQLNSILPQKSSHKIPGGFRKMSFVASTHLALKTPSDTNSYTLVKFYRISGNGGSPALTFNPQKWLLYNFFLQYYSWITHKGYENKRNDHQRRKLLIVKLILLVSTLKNVQRTVWRICILTLGCKGLRPWLKHKGLVQFKGCNVQIFHRDKYWISELLQARQIWQY